LYDYIKKYVLRQELEEIMRLDGQRILITGVSRPSGIGATLARRFAEAGATLAVHGYAPYDLELQYHDAAEDAISKLATAAGGAVTALTPCDLSQPGAAERVMAEATGALGVLDGLILNHAYSTHSPIGEWTEAHVDAHLLTNVRASMLMLQAFARQADPEKGGVATLFTSGQYLGPMVSEIAYAVSKDAVIGLCKQASAALAAQNIRVNCVNPGPNDTGYLTGEAYAAVAKRFPSGRWGTPDDTADLLLFLHSDYAKWITGQVIASEGGFQRI
jgi:3-oxoacyl-[acyl-carrier protein] reductase